MRFLLVCLLLLCLVAGSASGQGITARDKRIADTIKAVLLRSGIKKEQIDTFKIISIKQIADKEKMQAEIATAQNNVLVGGGVLKNDTSTIRLARVSINADSSALYTLSQSNKPTQGAMKELKEDQASLVSAYATLHKDLKTEQDLKKRLQDLQAAYDKADGTKKENYEVLTHMVLRSQQGKINTAVRIYLDKKYKMVGMVEVK